MICRKSLNRSKNYLIQTSKDNDFTHENIAPENDISKSNFYVYLY